VIREANVDVWEQWMERTRGGRESAGKIFERGARSRERNVREKCKRNRLRVKVGKREV
jgi:hypothetical protein